MRSFVNLQIFAPGKYLAASGIRTRKGFLTRVHPNVIHKFVLGLEGASVSRTVTPEACMIGALWTADMFHCDVGHYLVHRAECLVAWLLWKRLLSVDPEAAELLFAEARRVTVRHI